jgi:uncharacterized protein with LGFP repeats
MTIRTESQPSLIRYLVLPLLALALAVVSQLSPVAVHAAPGCYNEVVYGLIGDKWRALGAERGPLGCAIGPEARSRPNWLSGGSGVFRPFQHGYIILKWGDPEAYAVFGPIADKWNEGGQREAGFGYPTADTRPTSHVGPLGGTDSGLYGEFENGGVIYWTPATGAHVVYGQIFQAWNNVGRERGLGYPTSDEEDAPAGSGWQRVSHFQQGDIYWSPDRGTEVHRFPDPRVDPGFPVVR